MKRQLEGIKQIALFIAILWAIELVNIFTDRALVQFGLIPRNIEHLYGIITSPFLHYDLLHLIGNSIPLFFLAWLVHQSNRLLEVTLFVIVVSGSIVWLIGREATHIGASGLVMGYWGYLISYGWIKRSFKNILISVVTVLFYGGLIFTLLDFRQHISFEGHFAGFVSGVLAAMLLGRYQKLQATEQ